MFLPNLDLWLSRSVQGTSNSKPTYDNFIPCARLTGALGRSFGVRLRTGTFLASPLYCHQNIVCIPQPYTASSKNATPPTIPRNKCENRNFLLSMGKVLLP